MIDIIIHDAFIRVEKLLTNISSLTKNIIKEQNVEMSEFIFLFIK